MFNVFCNLLLRRSRFLAVGAIFILTGCSSYPAWIPSSGPSKSEVEDIERDVNTSGIRIVNVTDSVARQQMNIHKQPLFSDIFKNSRKINYRINDGDIIEIQVWEAPPASLFGSSSLDSSATSASSAVALPAQMVNDEGMITVPFVGQINVRNLSLSQIETLITQKLQKKANQPQVIVRLMQNNTENVTIVGDVASSVRMPLTAKGERLLDALAAAGGVRQPVNKMTLQITRGDKVVSLPLETIIKDPQQNIVLQSGDVVTSLFQSLSFTVLGATGKNEEINFESKGISLAQAIARAGGLNDNRADSQGVFIFRFEMPEALNLKDNEVATTPEGKVPVIYRVNLKDPATFFVAQNFPIEDKDLMYVSNASAAELQKFLHIVIGSVAYPILTVKSIAN